LNYASSWLDPSPALRDLALAFTVLDFNPDCGPMLVHDDSAPLGLLAKLSLIDRGVDERAVERHLLSQVMRHDEYLYLGIYSHDTVVAKGQRAIGHYRLEQDKARGLN
jgi:hypothetical protein